MYKHIPLKLIECNRERKYKNANVKTAFRDAFLVHYHLDSLQIVFIVKPLIRKQVAVGKL